MNRRSFLLSNIAVASVGCSRKNKDIPVESSMPRSLVRQIHVADDRASSNIAAIRFSPDNRLIRSYDQVTGIATHHIESGQRLSRIPCETHIHAYFSPDATITIFPTSSGLMIVDQDGKQRIFPTAMHPLCFIDSASIVGIGLDTSVCPEALVQYNLETGKVVSTPLPPKAGCAIASHALAQLVGVSHSVGYEDLGTDTKIELMALPSGTIERRISIYTGANHLIFTPTGDSLIGCLHRSPKQDSWNRLSQWSVSSGELVDTALAGNVPGDEVYCLAVDPTSNLLAVGTMQNLELWQHTPLRRIATIAHQRDVIICVDFSVDGKLLASGSGDGTICIWSVEDLRNSA